MSATELPVTRAAAPLREQVVTILRQAILDFRFAPGQRLVERELIEMLGVSRTTVREALGELKTEGLVTVVPQRGATVAVPDAQEAADLYDIRFRLEALVVERFVERATTSQVMRFEAAVEAFAEAVAADHSVHELLERRDEILSVLMEGAGSPTLQQFAESVQARVNILRAASMADRTRVEESIAEWRALAAAVRARDAKQAEALYGEHLRRSADVALARLSTGLTAPVVHP